jgi:glycosyltransferase involved in cell wall biosynthesis
LAQFGKTSGFVPEVAWAGQRDTSPRGQRYCEQLDALLAGLPEVRSRWTWLGLRDDIPQLLGQCDALIHPSLYEGMPNAVCEALAAGRPVLASAVCDHPLLVADGERGFLFDPCSPDDMVKAMTRFAQLDVSAREVLEINARQYAHARLGIHAMVDRYEALLAETARGSAGQGERTNARSE